MNDSLDTSRAPELASHHQNLLLCTSRSTHATALATTRRAWAKKSRRRVRPNYIPKSACWNASNKEPHNGAVALPGPGDRTHSCIWNPILSQRDRLPARWESRYSFRYARGFVDTRAKEWVRPCYWFQRCYYFRKQASKWAPSIKYNLSQILSFFDVCSQFFLKSGLLLLSLLAFLGRPRHALDESPRAIAHLLRRLFRLPKVLLPRWLRAPVLRCHRNALSRRPRWDTTPTNR